MDILCDAASKQGQDLAFRAELAGGIAARPDKMGHRDKFAHLIGAGR